MATFKPECRYESVQDQTEKIGKINQPTVIKLDDQIIGLQVEEVKNFQPIKID